MLLARADPTGRLSKMDAAFMERIGMRCVWFSQAPDNSSALVDSTGEYSAFFDDHHLEAVIVRPDRYIFGAVRHLK